MTPSTPSATLEISQRFYFDAAHRLQRRLIDQSETEGSRRIHGHTYHAEVAVQGSAHPATGMVMDLGLIRLEVEKVRTLLDHHFLDEVAGLGIPTLENLCAFIAKTMQSYGLKLTRVSVWREALGDRCTWYAT